MSLVRNPDWRQPDFRPSQAIFVGSSNLFQLETAQDAFNADTALLSPAASNMSQANVVQLRVERNPNHLDQLRECRSLQDCVALQTQIVRDNVEAFLQSAHRASERTTQFADTAMRQMSNTAIAPRWASKRLVLQVEFAIVLCFIIFEFNSKVPVTGRDFFLFLPSVMSVPRTP
jgi:hypothetical protein